MDNQANILYWDECDETDNQEPNTQATDPVCDETTTEVDSPSINEDITAETLDTESVQDDVDFGNGCGVRKMLLLALLISAVVIVVHVVYCSLMIAWGYHDLSVLVDSALNVDRDHLLSDCCFTIGPVPLLSRGGQHF